jgi:hypothetical protein
MEESCGEEVCLQTLYHFFLHLLCVKEDANRFPNSHNAHQEEFWEPSCSQRQFIGFGLKVQMGMCCCSFAM